MPSHRNAARIAKFFARVAGRRGDHPHRNRSLHSGLAATVALALLAAGVIVGPQGAAAAVTVTVTREFPATVTRTISAEPPCAPDGSICTQSTTVSRFQSSYATSALDFQRYEYQALVKFDLSQVTASATVRSARLKVSVSGADGPDTELRPVKGPYDASTVRWSDKNRYGALLFKTTLAAGTRTNLDVTSSAAGWVANPATNRGLALLPSTRLVHETYLAIAQDSDVTKRPALVVTYDATDTAPPTVDLTAPADGGKVFGATQLRASASDDTGVDRVEFRVDGVLVSSDQTAPYEATWDSTTVTDGPRTVTARAVDLAGNATTSPGATAQVANAIDSAERLHLDWQRGDITVDEYVEAGMHALFLPELLDPRYAAGEAPDAATFGEFASHQDDITETTAERIRVFFDQLRDGYYDTTTTESSGAVASATAENSQAMTSASTVECFGGTGYLFRTTIRCAYQPDGRFRIIFSPEGYQAGIPMTDTSGGADGGPNGVPDQLDDLYVQLDAAWDTYAGDLGYRAPTHTLLIKLADTSGGVAPPPGLRIIRSGGMDILLDYRNLGEYLPRHELFHTFQWQYAGASDWLPQRRLFDPFSLTSRVGAWAEATANWAVNRTYGELSTANQEYAANLPEFFSRPAKYLGSYESIPGGDSGREYGMFILAEYLQQRFDRSIIRRTWEVIGEPDDRDAGEAMDAALTENGSSLAKELPRFATWNYRLDASNTSPTTGYTSPDVGPWLQILGTDMRPAHTSVALPIGATAQTGEAKVEGGGAAYVELSVTGPAAVTLTASAGDFADDFRVRAQGYGTNPAVCTPEITVPVDGSNAKIGLPSGCQSAVLTITNVSLDDDERTLTWTAAAQLPAFADGDLMVGGASGQVHWYKTDGTFVRTLNSGFNSEVAGLDVGSNGNLYASFFQDSAVGWFDQDGWQGTLGGPYNSHPEGLDADQPGSHPLTPSLVVGLADGTGDLVTVPTTIFQFDPAGAWDVAREDRGADHLDLLPDGCTLYYTSEGYRVMRYNLCTSTQLSDFAVLPNRPAFGLQVLSDGRVLVAALDRIFELTSTGAVARTYAAGAGYYFGLSMDADESGFWVTKINAGQVMHFEIGAASPDITFNAPYAAAIKVVGNGK